jgi:sec-independent protein translocase protein TatA
MDVGVPELLIILFVVLLVFGSTRVPKLARSLGEAVREFRGAVSSDEAPDAPPLEPS